MKVIEKIINTIAFSEEEKDMLGKAGQLLYDLSEQLTIPQDRELIEKMYATDGGEDNPYIKKAFENRDVSSALDDMADFIRTLVNCTETLKD